MLALAGTHKVEMRPRQLAARLRIFLTCMHSPVGAVLISYVRKVDAQFETHLTVTILAHDTLRIIGEVGLQFCGHLVQMQVVDAKLDTAEKRKILSAAPTG